MGFGNTEYGIRNTEYGIRPGVFMGDMAQDRWAEWLLHRRHGGDDEWKQAMLPALFAMRDEVLGHARLAPGETLLDVGTGDGLLAFGAMPMLGEDGMVIFTDISQELLDYCRELAAEMGVLNRCLFIKTEANYLHAVGDGFVDVVTIRSVLIYVQDKPEAFREFYRALKPGGRISILEPINSFCYIDSDEFFSGYNVKAIKQIAHKVRAVYRNIQPPETDPMLNFDERDLLVYMENAGFTDIHLDLQVSISPIEKRTWDTFLHASGNPLIPPVEDAISQSLTAEEAAQFEAYLCPLVEEGKGIERMALAYLWAGKPSLPGV